MTAQQQVQHRVPSPKVNNGRVERELNDPVQGDPARGGLLTYETGAEGVEEDLEGADLGGKWERVE